MIDGEVRITPPANPRTRPARQRKTNRGLIGKLVLDNSSSPSSASTSASDSTSSGSSIPSPARTPPHSDQELERTSICSKHDWWRVYDAFSLMDRRHCGSVSRADFYEAISSHRTVEMRQAMKRANLHERFTSSAHDVSLAEFARLIWPAVTGPDVRQFMRWSTLREAAKILSEDTFKGDHGDIKRMFDLLDEDGSGTLTVKELSQARIMSKDEIRGLLLRQDFEADHQLSFREFCKLCQAHLTEKHTKKHVKDSKDGFDDWRTHARSAFRESTFPTRTANMILSESRDSDGPMLPAIAMGKISKVSERRQQLRDKCWPLLSETEQKLTTATEQSARATPATAHYTTSLSVPVKAALHFAADMVVRKRKKDPTRFQTTCI